MLSHFRLLALAAALVLLPQAALAAPVPDGAAICHVYVWWRYF